MAEAGTEGVIGDLAKNFRVGGPDDIACTVVFVVSNAVAFITATDELAQRLAPRRRDRSGSL